MSDIFLLYRYNKISIYSIHSMMILHYHWAKISTNILYRWGKFESQIFYLMTIDFISYVNITHIYVEIWDNPNDANNFCLLTTVSQFQVSSPLHNIKTKDTRANAPKHFLQRHKISSLLSIPRRLHSSQTGITINHQYLYIKAKISCEKVWSSAKWNLPLE